VLANKRRPARKAGNMDEISFFVLFRSGVQRWKKAAAKQTEQHEILC